MSLLISFMYLLLHLAIIVLIAALILWVLRWMGIPIDPMVYKIGQIIVALLCIIAVLLWLSGTLGWTAYRLPFFYPETQEDFAMKKLLLLATVALVALALPAQATVFNITTPNPTSATGNFSLSPGAGAFTDQVTFTITGPSTFTIANATNTFANPGQDAIANWSASIWDAVDGIVGNAGDVLLFGPQAAQACGVTPNCQIVGGSGLLNGPSLFYAQFTGTGSGTSGYSGNISTFAVPGPVVGAGLPGLIAACGGLIALARRRRTLA